MDKKGRKYMTYSLETKMKAVELKLKGLTHQQVADELGLADPERVKAWMRKYREKGEFGLVDQRGRRKRYVKPVHRVQRLEMENDVLKKWLEILKREGRR